MSEERKGIGAIFMNHRPKSGEIYKHFKDKLYQIVTIAKHSETGEELVIYQALYGEYKCYARPLELFMSEVDHEKYPDIKQKYRFERRRNNEADIVYEQAKDADCACKTYYGETNEKETVSKSNTEDAFEKEERKKQNMETSFEKEMRNKENAKHLIGKDTINSTISQVPSLKDMLKNMSTEEKMMAFFDTDDLEERYKILLELRDDITDTMIDNMAVVMDVVIEDGSLTKRYDDLKYAIQTKQRYEQNTRLR